MTWIKICGITNLEDALAAVDAGADAVGFVFHDKSPRNVQPAAAREINKHLPQNLERVGLFVNESAEDVSSAAATAGITAVQFHGDEYQNPERYAVEFKIFLGIPASRIAWSVSTKAEAWGSLVPVPENLAAIVLDSGTQEQRGGTGKTFDWKKAEAFTSVFARLYPIVIAGGLTASNVAEMIAILHPWGVDVSSGVEARPGKKDPDKVRAFIKAVREADKTNSRN